MLRSLLIQNFRAFGSPETEFRFGPISLIMGANASGKTAVLDAVGLLSQTATRLSNETGMKWRGKWVNFDQGQPAFHNGNSDLEIILAVGAELGIFKSAHPGHTAIRPETPLEFKICNIPKDDKWVYTCKVGNATAISSQPPPLLRFENAGIQGEFTPLSPGQSPFSSQHFLAGSARTSPGTFPANANIRAQVFVAAMLELRDWMARGIYLVGPDRIPRSEEQDLEKKDLSVGRLGEDTLNLLSYLFASPEFDEAAEKIKHWGRVFGLGALKAGWARRKELQAGFNDPETKTPLRIQHAGYGSQQMLPIITQIFAAPKGSTILVEEPEIGLHPGAHIDVVRLFADAVTFGQQVIFTTHSSTLPLALAECEAFGLSPADVTIYHLRREQGSVRVEKLTLDEHWVLKGWIPSFSEVEQELLKKWMQRVHDDLSQTP